MFVKKLSKLKIECECELQPVVEIVDFRKIVNVDKVIIIIYIEEVEIRKTTYHSSSNQGR
jgi:hypothetical protein